MRAATSRVRAASKPAWNRARTATKPARNRVRNTVKRVGRSLSPARWWRSRSPAVNTRSPVINTRNTPYPLHGSIYNGKLYRLR
jgi:hypothetical protein